MQMKITFSQLPLAALAVTLAAGLGCQTAKKPTASMSRPPQAPPPPVQTHSAAPVRVSAVHAQAEPQKPAAAPVSQAAPQTEAKTDLVQGLITKAETEYKAGIDQSLAGQPDQAKDHFDRAFGILLNSPAGMHSDLRFQKEFDRVTEGVSTLEAASQPASETPAADQKPDEEKSEPAPIDEANEVTNYPVDPKLKAKAAAEIKATHSDLPLMMTDQVAGYINYFSTRGHGTLERGLTRSGRYREMIQRTFREEGVPQDLIYLAQAESGFHPYAVSRAGARGIWQFMASRARAYDAVGFVQPSARKVDGHKVFTLIGRNGTAIAYLDIPPGLNPEPLLARRVGVRGQAHWSEDLGTRLITSPIINLLDSSPSPSVSRVSDSAYRGAACRLRPTSLISFWSPVNPKTIGRMRATATSTDAMCYRTVSLSG